MADQDLHSQELSEEGDEEYDEENGEEGSIDRAQIAERDRRRHRDSSGILDGSALFTAGGMSGDQGNVVEGMGKGMPCSAGARTPKLQERDEDVETPVVDVEEGGGGAWGEAMRSDARLSNQHVNDDIQSSVHVGASLPPSSEGQSIPELYGNGCIDVNAHVSAEAELGVAGLEITSGLEQSATPLGVVPETCSGTGCRTDSVVGVDPVGAAPRSGDFSDDAVAHRSRLVTVSLQRTASLEAPEVRRGSTTEEVVGRTPPPSARLAGDEEV